MHSKRTQNKSRCVENINARRMRWQEQWFRKFLIPIFLYVFIYYHFIRKITTLWNLFLFCQLYYTEDQVFNNLSVKMKSMIMMTTDDNDL